MNLKKAFQGRIVEILWFSLSFFGVSWIIVTDLFLDNKSNPIYLSQLNGMACAVVAGLFVLRSSFSDKALRFLFFPVLANSMCIALGRLYLDFDCGSPWIVHFQSINAKYSAPEIYRTIDFFTHFLNPIGFLHLVLNDKERVKNIFYKDSIGNMALHYILPVIFFSAWYGGIFFCGYTLKDIYLTRALGLAESILILLLIPLMITLPIHWALGKEDRGEIARKFLKSLIYIGSFSIVCASFFTYQYHTLHLNTIFLMSLTIFILMFLNHFKILQQTHYQALLPVICSLSIFIFFINEMHVWSTGGNEDIYLSTLQKATNYSAVNLHYIIKIIFYMLIVVALYAFYVFATFKREVQQRVDFD